MSPGRERARRLSLVVAILGALVGVVAPVGHASADVGCGDVFDSLTPFNVPDDLWTHDSGSGAPTFGFLDGGSLPGTATQVVSTLTGIGGGAQLAATRGALGGSAGVAGFSFIAASIGSVVGTCAFLDVVNADKLAADKLGCGGTWWSGVAGWVADCPGSSYPSGLIGHDGLSLLEVRAGWWNGNGPTSGGSITANPYRRYRVGVASPITSTGAALFQLQRVSAGRTLTRGGVTLPDRGIMPQYVMPPDAWVNAGTCAGCKDGLMSTYYSVVGRADVFETSNLSFFDPTGKTELDLMVRCRGQFTPPADHVGSFTPMTFSDVGGMCGVQPKTMLVAAHHTNQSVGFSMVADVARALYGAGAVNGWARRYVADGLCVGSGGTGSWVRAESASFLDVQDTAERVPVPLCGTGQMLAEVVLTKVPTGVECGLGRVCWPNSQIYRYSLPAEWRSTGTAPDWTACLRTGAAGMCGVPELAGGVCTWGGFALPDVSWCNPSRQTSIQETATTDLGLNDGTPVDVTATPVGVPVSTGTPVETETTPPPGEGGSGTTIEVPIDEGDGEPCDVKSESACFGPVIDGTSGGECFPSGWGWANPVQWVLRPIKCALVWAFVPPDDAVQESWDGLMAQVDDRVPFAWVSGGVGVATALGDGISVALEENADECFVWLPAVEFGGGEVWADQSVCFAEIIAEYAPNWAPFRAFFGQMLWAMWAMGMVLVASRILGGQYMQGFPDEAPNGFTDDGMRRASAAVPT